MHQHRERQHEQTRVSHEVFNQAELRVDVNEYTSNVALVEAVERFGGHWGGAELVEVGALVGSESYQLDAELANKFGPELRTHDRYGNRIDAVDFHPAYHRVTADSIRHGAHTRAWVDPRPGANVVRAGVFMQFAQIEPGHTCPISMTHAAVPSLKLTPKLADLWLPRVYSREYDPRLVAGKSTAIGRFPGSGTGGGRADLFPGAARAAGRGKQCIPHPAAQGQTRQQVQRVRRDRVGRDDRLARRRGRPRCADHH